MGMKEQALQYEQLGFSVIPLLPKDKKPLVPWTAFQQKKALPEQILAWWDQHPQANLGIVTGQISGIFVLDVDGIQGQESLKGKHLPPTVTSRTGGGGIHYLYRYPGFEVKTCTNLLPKVDIRGDGGYIAAPPSIHPNGTAYEWAISPDDGEISQAPFWLLGLLDNTRGATKKEISMPNPVEVLHGVPQGERDDRLYQYACSLRARAVKKEEAEILILKAAGSCSPPFPEKQALAKLDSAWKHPPGYGEEQDIYTALETVHHISPDNVYDPKSIQALAMLYTEEPAEYAKARSNIKKKYKTTINLTTLEKAVKKEAVKQRKQERQIVLAVPGEEERALAKLFPELELNHFLCPPGWILNPGGVFKASESGCICVCSVPLIIAERLRNADTQNERVTLQWKRDNRWQTCKADRASVFNNMALIQLANKGLPVASSNAKNMVKYLMDFEKENIACIPVKQSISHFGWVNGTTFIPGVQGKIILDLDEGRQAIAEQLHPKGELKDWIELIRPLRQYPIARTVLAAGFTSPLLLLIGQRTFLLHPWGPSKGGKTAATLAALSIWGNPLELLANFNSTLNGLERKVALFHSLPFGIDEQQMIKDQAKVSQIIYALGAGHSKERSTRSGSLQTVATWNNIIITTGEQPLTDEYGTTGAKTRALELYGKPIEDEEYAHQLHVELGNLYGTAGPKFIQHIIQMNNEIMIATHKDIHSRLQKEHPKLAGSHLGYIASLMLGDYWSGMYIFGKEQKKAWDEAMSLSEELTSHLVEESAMSDAQRAYEYLESWFATNYTFFENPKFTGQSYGFFEDDVLYITPDIFSTVMQKAGFPVERIKRDWADMGIILCETYKGKRRFTVRKKGKDGTGRRLPYIAIKFKGQRVYQ